MNAAERESRVRQAFAAQAGFCAQLGSPFTATLCTTLGERLRAHSSIESAILHWSGDPAAEADNLPLRVAGALHALVRAGSAPDLALLYPPAPTPDPLALYAAASHTLAAHAAHVAAFLTRPPQTNEVGRSALLLAGLLHLAARFRKPIVLLELGASAGLNLLAERYRCRFGDRDWTPAGAHLTLAPRWQGAAPRVATPLAIMRRRGCDLSPIDLGDQAERARLLAYVWADQADRLARLEAAIQTAQQKPPIVDRMEASRWLEARLGEAPPPNAMTVVWHSIFWGYVEPAHRQGINELMAMAGEAATPSQPLAWLRMEIEQGSGPPVSASLRLTLWPNREETLLAWSHPHGSAVEWLAT